MKTIALSFILFATLALPRATAQHADIRPSVADGRIVTGGYVDATSTELPGLRVFGYDFGEDPGQPYFVQDPGFNAAAGSGLPGGSLLSFNIVGAGSLGLPANLSYWGGAGEVAFAVTPANEMLQLSLGGQSVLADDGTSLVPGFGIQTVAASGSVHRHLNAQLQVAGGNPAAGIYLVPLELASSDLGLQKSLPFFLVYNNGLSEALHDEAIDWVQENLLDVPEPGALPLAAIAFGVPFFSRRRRTAGGPRATSSARLLCRRQGASHLIARV